MKNSKNLSCGPEVIDWALQISSELKLVESLASGEILANCPGVKTNFSGRLVLM